MSKIENDRRAHPRHERTFEIEGAVESVGVTARMTARNLSLGGVYCSSTRDFPEMTRLAVRLMLPVTPRGVEPVDVEAVVVRRTPIASPTGSTERYELALFFTRVEDDQRQRLTRFIERSV